MLPKRFSLLFYLKKRNNYIKGNLPIYMRITIDAERIELSTQRDCEPERWNASSAQILANEMLQEYLTKELSNLVENPVMHPARPPKSTLQWTAAKASMVELIYALQSEGVYNNGNVEIKEIATYLEVLFQVDLGNYYHTFNEIRLRKKNRTQLLDRLKEKLVKKMDEMDEK